MYWRNVVIEDNTVVAGHAHGIYVARRTAWPSAATP